MDPRRQGEVPKQIRARVPPVGRGRSPALPPPGVTLICFADKKRLELLDNESKYLFRPDSQTKNQ